MTQHGTRAIRVACGVAVLALVASGCSGTDDDTSATVDPVQSTVADGSGDSSEADMSDDGTAADTTLADDAPAEASATCTSEVVDPAHEFVTISFTASESGRMDYWVRVAEPGGEDDALFEIVGVENGQVVNQREKMVGPPTVCTVISVETEPSEEENLEDIVSCDVIESDVGNLAAALTIANSGAEPADYIYKVAFFDASGARVLRSGGSIKELAPGTSEAHESKPGGAFDASYTCEGIWVFRR